MTNRHMKRLSMSLIVREMQNKTTVKYHFTPVRMAITNKSTKNQSWQKCGEKGTLSHCWWECRLVQGLWTAVWRYLKKLKMDMPFDPAIPLLGIYLKEPKTLSPKNKSSPLFIVMLTITKIWKLPQCSSLDDMSGGNNCGTFTQWNTTCPYKRRNFHPLQ